MTIFILRNNKKTLQKEKLYIKEIELITLTLLQGWWGRCRKNYLPKEEGRVEEKKHAPGPGFEPGTCHVLGEGPQLHARGAV